MVRVYLALYYKTLLRALCALCIPTSTEWRHLWLSLSALTLSISWNLVILQNVYWSLVAVEFIISSSPDVFSISSYAWSWSVVSLAKMSAQVCFTLHCGSTACVCWASAPHPGLAHFKSRKLLGLLSFNNSSYVLDISPSSGKHFVLFSVCGLSFNSGCFFLLLKSSEQSVQVLIQDLCFFVSLCQNQKSRLKCVIHRGVAVAEGRSK